MSSNSPCKSHRAGEAERSKLAAGVHDFAAQNGAGGESGRESQRVGGGRGPRQCERNRRRLWVKAAVQA
jgi:hypothetical protein